MTAALLAYAPPDDTYGLLATQFDKHGSFDKGGVTLIHITGEQAITRLNEVLGPENWDFKLVGHGATTVEVWVIGELTVRWPNGTVSVKQHVGNQDIARGAGASSDTYKAATTDALKKCASLVGIGLYLFDADERAAVKTQMAASGQLQSGYGNTGYNAPAQPQRGVQIVSSGPATACYNCGGPIEGTQFSDGKIVSAETVAGWGIRNHGVPLCLKDYSAAKKGQLQIAAPQNPTEDVPF